VPSNDNWLDPLTVAVCLLAAFALHRVLPSLSSDIRAWFDSRRRHGWASDIVRWLDPVIVVACLFACQAAYGGRVSISLVYLALITFIISSAGQTPVSKPPASCSRIVLRWGAIVAGLLFLAFAFDVGALFSRSVLLTWFVITPIALCVAQAVRLRLLKRSAL